MRGSQALITAVVYTLGVLEAPHGLGPEIILGRKGFGALSLYSCALSTEST